MIDSPLQPGLRRAFLHLFPFACAGCEEPALPGSAFCDVCAPTAYPLQPPWCGRCRVPLDVLTSHSSLGPDALCGRCARCPPGFEEIFAPWEYEGAVADGIRRVKYGGDLPALRALCRAARPSFVEFLNDHPEAVLIPIPAHARELRGRGFHLPTLMFRLMKLPAAALRPQFLTKKHPTKRQASLPLLARAENIKGAFRAPRQVRGGLAIVIDDVVTTGATADCAARCLKGAGFERIKVLALARAPLEAQR